MRPFEDIEESKGFLRSYLSGSSVVIIKARDCAELEQGKDDQLAEVPLQD